MTSGKTTQETDPALSNKGVKATKCLDLTVFLFIFSTIWLQKSFVLNIFTSSIIFIKNLYSLEYHV